MQYCPETADLPGLPPGGPAPEPAQPPAAPVGARRGVLPRMTQAEKAQRAAAKRSALLAFLASNEVWTVAEIAARICGTSKRRAVATLDAMERDALIATEALTYGGRSIKLYGITPHGCAVAGVFEAPHFERGRTNPAYIPHRLEGQRARLQAEAAGWTGWQPERALRAQASKEGWKKIPDALGINKDGERVAVEVERFTKTPKRYSELILLYLQEIKNGRYHHVDFVCPPGVETLVQRAMGRVDAVRLNGEVVAVTDAHRARFRYYSLATWPEANHG